LEIRYPRFVHSRNGVPNSTIGSVGPGNKFIQGVTAGIGET
jgi:hypothetical protein